MEFDVKFDELDNSVDVELGALSPIKGKDGFSPIATVEQTETGATVTVTDASGTTTAAFLNGKDGAQGDKGDKGDIGGTGDYLPLAGGTCTGGVIAPNFQTGTTEAAYFQTKKMRGQGNADTYNHAVDWGYSGHDRVDFYEYGGTWNFYQCQSSSKSAARLIGSVKSTGWNGGAVLTGTPTAPTAAEGTNTTQIATTAFVQAAIQKALKDAGLI